MPRLVQLFLLLATLLSGTARAGDGVDLVPVGAEWKYLDDGSDQGTAWREPDFEDSAWPAGPAQLGFGDGDEATPLAPGAITYYFRHTFTGDDVEAIPALVLRILRDDGAVVYVNGMEVYRTNMPDGAISYLTPASSTVGHADEHNFFPAPIDPDLLVTGDNTLAVEVHQRALDSSDISFDLSLTATNGLPTIIRGPYLQTGTPHSIIVRWTTLLPSETRLAYGTSPDALDTHIIGLPDTTLHEVMIDQLEAQTQYFYAIETKEGIVVGGDEEHAFITSPRSGTALPTRLWVIGDCGEGNASAEAVRDAYLQFAAGRRTDVFLLLGDNAYNDGSDSQYQAAVFDMYRALLRQTPAWSTLGNHDALSADSPTQSGVYYNVFTLPANAEAGGLASGTEAYYSFDYGNVHFICLDSQDTNRAPDGAMMTWLEADLADTLADWIIAFWHHPPYSKGSHNSDDPTDSGGRMHDMREVALPILEAGGVDLVLTGHSHSYERSFLLDGHYGTSDTLDPSTMILDDGDGRIGGDGAYAKPSSGPAPHEGAVYAVAGSSSKTSGGALNHPAMFISLNSLGSMVLDVDGDRLDALFLNAQGVMADSFTIIKGGGQMTGDLNGDGLVNAADLALLLGAWGDCPLRGSCEADLDGDGVVGPADLAILLGSWSSGP